MAKYGPDDLFVLVGGYNLTGYTTSVEVSRGAMLEQSNTLGDTWHEQAAVGVSDGSASVSGFYDDATGGTNDALVEAQGTAPVFVFGLAGNAQGQSVVGMQGAMTQSVARSASRDAIQKISVSYAGHGAIEDGEIIQSLAAESGDGATSDGSEDNGASTAGGAALYLEVTSLTLGGYTSVTVVVEDSANDSTWATLGTFTAVTAIGAERIVVAAASATPDRYMRVNLTWNGSGSSESITLLVAAARL